MDKFNINIPNILDKKIFVHKYINLDININLNKSVHKTINEKYKDSNVQYLSINDPNHSQRKKLIPYQNMIKKRMASNFDIKNIDIFNETFYLLSENEIMKILSSDAKDINNIDNLLKISYKNDIDIHNNLNDRKFLTNDELKKEINLLENRINSLKSFNSELNELKESLEIRLKRLKWRMAKLKIIV